jgi:hypothetical protein
MAKVGPFITAQGGAYCEIKLDSGEKILVNHEQGGFKGGRLTIDRVKLMGLSSETVFEIDLDSPAGKAALAALTPGVSTGAAGTPLGAFVAHVKDCPSLAQVVERCRALTRGG